MTVIELPHSRIAKRVALIGNPNCGKTTLFNQLTGSSQRVGNWAGVTVERKSGYLKSAQGDIEIIDLPGTYSLTLVGEVGEDEAITRDFLRQGQYDLILNVVDAVSLERNLYLTLQLLELGLPLVLVVNRYDLVSSKQSFSVNKLSKQLGCPVFSIIATEGEGLPVLKQYLQNTSPKPSVLPLHYHEAIEREINNVPFESKMIRPVCPMMSRHKALSILEGEETCQEPEVFKIRERILSETGSEPDVLIATQRYRFLEALCRDLFPSRKKSTFGFQIDTLILNRFLGLPIFFAVMYVMFVFAINVGGIFQDSFDIFSNALFVDGPAIWLKQLHIPDSVIAILAYGVGKGINTTLTFIPVIGAMFLALTFLEDSGFMARAAFVMDRLMRALGLPGKAFVPMIVGFGCNVPAILGARHLENKRDRILTVMMSPFMSCGARLAIFTVFVAAFVPMGGQNWVFALYVIGILMAIFTGLILKRTLLKGPSAPLILEMPEYHWPHLTTLLRHTWHRLSKFIFNAGKLIVVVCAIMGTFNAIQVGEKSNSSILSETGKLVTPLFKPIGLEEENWPATVALLSGVLAKEVVVGTLNTLYQQALGEDEVMEADWSLKSQSMAAIYSIGENVKQLGGAILNPVTASAPIESLAHSSTQMMRAQFDGQAGAFAYLLFILLYFPCVSAVSAIAKEVNRKWAMFSVLWTTSLAYLIAAVFYQAATFSEHPVYASCWIGSCMIFLVLAYVILRTIAKKQYRRRELPTRIRLSTTAVSPL
ncbi:MAG: Fe(2+) transporter permease subunit FeoB [Gammaproteobacteria bacterium]